MLQGFFNRYRNRQYAAWFALFAMALIIVAPLISVSLQKDPMRSMPGMDHAMSMSHGHGDSGMTHPASMPAHDMEACGYCVLFAHVPGLLVALVLVLSLLIRRQRLHIPPPLVLRWYFSPRLRPETRAPPRMSAFIR